MADIKTDELVFIDGMDFGYWGEAKLIVSAPPDGPVSVTVIEDYGDGAEALRIDLQPDQAHWLGTKLRLAAKKAGRS